MCFVTETIAPVYLNTKGGDSIALYPIDSDVYLKETYEGFDLKGQLRSSQLVTGPWNRDGLVFNDVGNHTSSISCSMRDIRSMTSN